MRTDIHSGQEAKGNLIYGLSALFLVGMIGGIFFHKFARLPAARMRADVPLTAEKPAAGQLITEEQAPFFKKQYVSIEGVVQYNFNSGKQTVFSFHEHHKGFFKALVRHQYYVAFARPPDLMYPIGTRIRITGLLEWYQGDQTIFVTSPDQIEAI